MLLVLTEIRLSEMAPVDSTIRLYFLSGGVVYWPL